MQRRLLFTFFGWLAALTVLTLSLLLFSNPILPAPTVLFARIGELLLGPLWSDLVLTVLRSVVAFLIALFFGIGWAAVFPPRSARAFVAGPSLLLLQAAPVILWIVPLVLLIGTGNAAPIAAAVFVVLPLIAFEFRAAFEMTSRDRREFWRHYVPYYPRRLVLRLYHEWRPHLAAATGMGLLMSFKASVIAEWFAAKEGIGRQLQQSFVVVDTASFLAYALAFLFAALWVTSVAQAAVQRIGFVRSLFVAERQSRAGEADVLQLTNISVKLGRRLVLCEVELELQPGELLILTGASGSGKSTLARVAAGLLKPQKGNVMAPANSVCLVFQSDFLFPQETVAENVSLHIFPDEHGAAERAIHLVGLEGQMVAGNLSGGMRRRLALARGLCSTARFLLLDEPFSGLDAQASSDLLQVLLAEAKAGRGILLITHHLSPQMRAVARGVYTVEGGRLRLET